MTRKALISVDVEEWFHFLDSEATPPEDEWDQQTVRVPEITAYLIDVLGRYDRKITFFVLGWVARKHPEAVRAIHRAGHEVASHSFRHPLLFRLGRCDVERELREGKDILEQVTGEEVIGFRAPGFSIRRGNAWALDCIAEAGFRYDSSLVPAWRFHGGLAGVKAAPHLLQTPSGYKLVEIPVSSIGIGRIAIPFGGGGYFRLAPLAVTVLMARAGACVRRPLVSYLHPRDIDPGTPRLPLSGMRSFRSYVGVASARRKLEGLLAAFPTQRYDDFALKSGLM